LKHGRQNTPRTAQTRVVRVRIVGGVIDTKEVDASKTLCNALQCGGSIGSAR
jgi:hypothetical protein